MQPANTILSVGASDRIASEYGMCQTKPRKAIIRGDYTSGTQQRATTIEIVETTLTGN